MQPTLAPPPEEASEPSDSGSAATDQPPVDQPRIPNLDTPPLPSSAEPDPVPPHHPGDAAGARSVPPIWAIAGVPFHRGIPRPQKDSWYYLEDGALAEGVVLLDWRDGRCGTARFSQLTDRLLHGNQTARERVTAQFSRVRDLQLRNEFLDLSEWVPPRRPTLSDRPVGHSPIPMQAQLVLSSPVELDAERLHEIRNNSAHVAQLLAEVYGEADSPAPRDASLLERAPDDAAAVTLVRQLDRAHRDLLAALSHREQWARHDAVVLCTSQGVLLDGAYDVLNEAALDQAGDLVLEGFDPILVYADIAREML